MKVTESYEVLTLMYWLLKKAETDIGLRYIAASKTCNTKKNLKDSLMKQKDSSIKVVSTLVLKISELF